MRQSIIFTLPEQAKEFNEFVKDHPPIGENGIKGLPGCIFMQYEDGELVSKERQISTLRAELNTLISNSIEEERQFRDSIKTRDSFDIATHKHQWIAMNDGLIPQQKAVELTRIKIDVCIEMLQEMGEKVKYEHREIPVPSVPEEFKKSDGVIPVQGKGKKNK